MMATQGCGELAAPETAAEVTPTETALTFFSDPPLGNLSTLGRIESHTNVPGRWADVPRFATGVFSREGDNLEVNVSARVTATGGGVWLRALVDGVVASPSDVVFFQAGTETTGVRSFSFIATGMTAGFLHLVRIQWYTAAGVTATMNERSLNVRSASAGWGNARMAVIAPASGPGVTKSTSSWENIPGLSTNIMTAVTSEIHATLSGEILAGGPKYWVRVLVDGAASSPGDIVIESNLSATKGTRSIPFFKVAVPAGTHTVTAQWYSDGGTIYMGDRTLSVVSTPVSHAEGGGSGAVLETGAVAFTSTTWADIGGTSFSNQVGGPGAGVKVMGALQSWTGGGAGTLHIRALIDGVVADPADIPLEKASFDHTQSFHFSRKDFPSGGSKTVVLQARVDSGVTGYIADRVVIADAVRRTGADFAQAHPQLAGVDRVVSPRAGTFDMLTICIDPVRPEHPRPTEAQIRNAIEGGDGGLSVRGHYTQSSGGRLTVGTHNVVGCGTPSAFLSPTSHQRNWYWDNNEFDERWKDAIAAADPSVDFHSFDFNLDNKITPNEVVINICSPQNDPYGTIRSVTMATDGNPTPLEFTLIDCYFSADDTKRRWQVGLLAHEHAHVQIDAWDIHTNPASTAPGVYSLMDIHGSGTHLDPFHRLRAGFLIPDLVDVNRLTSAVASMPAVESAREAAIVYNPARGNKEYFIVENRFTGALSPANYDSTLPTSGPALWHILEDPAAANALPPEGTTLAWWTANIVPGGWGRTGIRFLGVMAAGTYKALKWADGSKANVRLNATTGSGNPSSVTFENTLRTYTGTVTAGTQIDYGPFYVPAGDNIVATLSSGTPDADLYVRKGAVPTTSLWDCRPFQSDSNETCVVAGAANMYVSVRGFSGTVPFTLTVSWSGN